MNSPRRNPDSLQPLVFEDGTVLQVYPSLEETFMPLPGSGAEPPTETPDEEPTTPAALLSCNGCNTTETTN
jgi:hypothetical protein